MSRGQRPVERVVSLGGGSADTGIAQVLAVAGYRVTLCADPEALALARADLDGGRFGLLAATDAGRISGDERMAALDRVSFSEQPEEPAAAADLLILTQAGPPEATATLLGSLEAALGPDAVVACNSEGDPVASLAGDLRCPQRFLVWRWGWPTQTSKLAEIVQGPLTSPEVTETVVQVARRAGKNPVVLGDAPEAWGYVTNRTWSALRTEAARIVEEGVAGAAEVDQLLVDCFGWPSGPFGRGAQPH